MGRRWGELGCWGGVGGKGRKLYLNNNKKKKKRNGEETDARSSSGLQRAASSLVPRHLKYYIQNPLGPLSMPPLHLR